MIVIPTHSLGFIVVLLTPTKVLYCKLHSCNVPPDMMAWFEVQQILQSGSENKQSTGMVEEEELFKEQCHVLIVQFNPAGIIIILYHYYCQL